MRHAAAILTAALAFGCAAPVRDGKSTAGPPVQVRVKSRAEGKGYFCTVALALENRHDFPVWFVFADAGNQLLRYDGKFSADDRYGKVPFEASEYNEGKGSAIFVNCFGDDGFLAVLLPAQGHFHFGGFSVEGGTPLRFFDVWEVKSLKVNGKTPLQQWLPYPVSSSPSVGIAGGMYSGQQDNLKWLHERTPDAKPYPDEEVKTVIAEPIGRYVMPLP